MKDSVAEKQLNVILHTNFLRLFKNAHTNDNDAYWDVYQTIVITVMFEKKNAECIGENEFTQRNKTTNLQFQHPWKMVLGHRKQMEYTSLSKEVPPNKAKQDASSC